MLFKLRCIVLEDEDDNRDWLLKKLAGYPELEIVGWGATLDESYALIAQTKPDAAFMDIQLIGGDAFMLLNRLQMNGLPIPYIVMTTGYPEYVMTALNDYRRFVVQYLVKPFVENWQTKLRKAVDALLAAKMNDSLTLAQPATGAAAPAPASVFINNRGSLLRLDFDKIAYLEAAGQGETFIVTDTETCKVDMTLNKCLELLPAGHFQRVSRTNIVNTAKIVRINRDDRTVDLTCGGKNKTVGVGDAYYSELLKFLPMAKEGPAKPAPPPDKPVGESVILDREIAGKIQSLQEEKNELFIEKQKSDHLLHNILPDEVAEELKQTGQTIARKYELVTVMFADIKDFTRIAEKMPPEALVQEIDYCFRHFDAITEQFQVEKIKTIGDCYMCAGGLPKEDDSNPKRVVQAALEMQKFLAEYKARRETENLPWFEARIGIHTGPVVAGVVGQRKFTYDIWGDTVNIASRIEENGQPGKVCISAATYELVKKEFLCRYAGTILAKNKGELEAYFVEG